MSKKSRFHLSESEKLELLSALQQRMRIPIENRGRFRPPELVNENVIAGWKWYVGIFCQDKPKKLLLQVAVLFGMLLITCYQHFL